MTSGLIWLIDDLIDFALLICKNIRSLDRKWRQYQTGDTLTQVSFLRHYFLVTFYETVLFNNTKVCTSWQFRDHNTETKLLLLDWISKKLLSNQTGLRINECSSSQLLFIALMFFSCIAGWRSSLLDPGHCIHPSVHGDLAGHGVAAAAAVALAAGDDSCPAVVVAVHCLHRPPSERVCLEVDRCRLSCLLHSFHCSQGSSLHSYLWTCPASPHHPQRGTLFSDRELGSSRIHQELGRAPPWSIHRPWLPRWWIAWWGPWSGVSQVVGKPWSRVWSCVCPCTSRESNSHRRSAWSPEGEVVGSIQLGSSQLTFKSVGCSGILLMSSQSFSCKRLCF